MENDNRYTRTTRTNTASRRQPSDVPTSRQQRVASSMRTGSTSASERSKARASAGRYAAAGRTTSSSASRTSAKGTYGSQTARTAATSGTASASSRVRQVQPDSESSYASTARTSSASRVRQVEPESTGSTYSRTRTTSAAGTSRTSGVPARTRTQSTSTGNDAVPARTRTQNSSAAARTSTARSQSSASAAGNQTAARSTGTQTRSSSSASRAVKPVKKSGSAGAALSAVKDKFSDAASKAKTKAASAKKTDGEKKKGLFGLSRFTSFIIIYSAIFVVLIILVAIILSAALKSYESRQPSHVVEDIVEDFSSTDSLRSFLDKNSSIIRGTDSVLNFEDTYYSMVEGKEISYVADSSKTTLELSAYNITADGAPVAGIELTKNSSNTWDLTSVDITAAYKDVKGYSILVPDGATVYVNGNQLGESSITGTGTPAILEYSAQFLKNPPQFTTYTVKLPSGGSIDVSGTDSNGNPLNFSQSEDTYVAGDGAAQSFIDEVKETVETGVDEYALYFEFLAFNLEDYILKGSELHEFIFGSEEFDPINPGLYMYEYINTHDFKEKSITNYTVYSDDCFTVDVKYDLLITFNTEGPYGTQNLPDDELTMDATWVWVKSGDNWYISEIVNH